MTVSIGLLSAEAESKVEDNGRLVKSYTEKYLYKTTAGTRPTYADIIADVGIAPGSPYALDTAATAGTAHIEHLQTRPPHCAAHVTVTWSTNSAAVNTVSTDPSTVFTLWSLQPQIMPTYITRDRDNKLIVNAAGQPFDGGIPVDKRFGTAVATKNIADASFNKESVLTHSGKVNSVTYLGAAPGTLQIDIAAHEKRQGSWHWWELTYSFKYDPLGIQPKVPNVGFYQLGRLSVPVPITYGDLTTPPGSDATKVQEPEPLYDAAAELADPTHVKGHVVPYNNRPDGCSFVTANHFAEMDFSSLGI